MELDHRSDIIEAQAQQPLPGSCSHQQAEQAAARGTDDGSLRDIQIKGPAAMQEASVVKAAVAILQEHSLCRVETTATGGRPSPKLIISPLADTLI
ncbi:hypothetical protein [Aestuariivirga sp.]|uniref:hypothetical protein n=1 Tax=Aestuariivirga sp. TaxID=2650926 RepID=UPI00301B2B7F